MKSKILCFTKRFLVLGVLCAALHGFTPSAGFCTAIFEWVPVQDDATYDISGSITLQDSDFNSGSFFYNDLSSFQFDLSVKNVDLNWTWHFTSASLYCIDLVWGNLSGDNNNILDIYSHQYESDSVFAYLPIVDWATADYALNVGNLNVEGFFNLFGFGGNDIFDESGYWGLKASANPLVVVTPEPGTSALVLLGLGGLLFYKRRYCF